jgi:hypothetical protein
MVNQRMEGSLTLREYMEFIVPKIEDAERTGNRDEAIRLLRLLSEVALEQADKLSRST